MTEHKHHKTMARETFLYLPAKIAEGLIGIFTISFYAALFTSFAYGDYLLLHTIVIFASLVLTGWLVNSTTRFVGENTDPPHLKEFYSTAFSAWGIITLLVYLICFSAYFLFERNLLYLCPAFLFTSYSLFQILSAALVQLRKIKLGIILALLSACLKLGVVLAAFLLLKRPESILSPYPAIAAMFVSDLFAALAALFVLRIPSSFSFKAFSPALSKQFFDFGFPLLGVSVSIGLLNLVDRFIVSGFADNAALAVYNANYSISSSVFTLVMAAIMRGVYPSILEGYRRGGRAEALPLINYGTRMYVLIALPAAAGLIAVSPALSRLMFVRPEYAAGIPVIGLIAAAMFFMGLTEYANKAWELEKDTRPILFNSLAAVLVKVSLSILFVRLYGITGAALGTLAAFIVYFTLSALRVRKRFLFSLHVRVWLNLLISSLLCAAAAFLICRFSPFQAIITLILAVLAGSGFYALSLSLSGEIKAELHTIKTRFQKNTQKNNPKF